MTVYSATSLGVGPLRIVTTPSLRVVSGPSDSRHAAFVVSTSHGSEAVYRRVIDAGGNCEESSRADLLEEMAARGARRAWGPVVLVVGVLSTLFALAASSVLALSLLIATVVGSVVIFRGDAARRRLFVLYVMDAASESAYGGLLNGLGWIERSSQKWSARGVVVFAKPLAPLTTNIDLREVKLGITLRLQFAPDGVYVFSGAQMSFVPYGQLTVSAARHRQVQSIPASDSPRIGQQHKYTNKHGSPDRRHKFNPILPVVETGSVNFTSTGTLTETILLSNPVAAEHFGNAIGAMALQPAPTPPRLAAKPEPARTVTMMAPKSVAVPRRDEPAPAVIRGSANSVGIKREEPRPLSPQAPDGNALWISPSRAMLVHGLDIGGFVYVGQHLRGLDLTFEEPALIDPTLAIDRSNQGATIDHSVGYSLSYSKLPPHGRAAFLQWLSTGRRDPALPIGLVFLFLYGLERRAYEYLGGKGSDQAECMAIARELERLLAIYTNASFVGYGGRLLDLLSAREPQLIAPSRGDHWRHGDPLPLRILQSLGELSAKGEVIPPSLAMAWLRRSPIVLRTPATRCEPEFEKLFSIRYSQEPDGGLRVRPNKTQIQVRYTPASPALRERMHTLKGVPDITALSRPVDSLAKIAERCCDELDAYSRWLAKNPNSRGSLAAVSLLPAELVSTYDSEDIRALDSFISDRIAGSDNAIIAADELLFYWPVTNPLKVTKSEAVQLAQSCEKLGIGIEPDVRFGGPPPASGGSIVVFRRSQNAPAAPSPEYSAAVLLARLGVTVGSANGALATLEREELHRSVGDAFELAAAERRRLDAHIEWLIAAGPGTAGLKKQLAAMTADQRLRISAYVTRVAAADGVVDAAEMRALEKIYNSLGLSTDDLYRNMHATISGGETPTPAVTSKSSPFALDRGRLQIKLAETASVSSLLADVFADEDTAVPSAYASSAVVSATVLGSLDDAQSELLRELAHRSEWPRHEVEILASSHELLIDGALESINDYAFERAGEALWEGDDPITINEQVAKEILA